MNQNNGSQEERKKQQEAINKSLQATISQATKADEYLGPWVEASEGLLDLT